MRRIIILSTLLTLVGAMPASAQDAPQRLPRIAHYVGSDTNWFNPANWSTGRVPDEHTTVVLDGTDDVVIDPALDPATDASRGHALYQDIFIPDQARLTTLPGTIMQNRHTVILGQGQLIQRSTEGTSRNGNLLVADLTSMTLDATAQTKSTVVLMGSVTFGVGGAEPAAPGHVGRGHYATLTGGLVLLSGRLDVELLDGFTPGEGDVFDIITATRALVGQFEGLPEGALVARVNDDLGLFVSYRQGGVKIAVGDVNG